ncbi:hypothetical protein O3M35_007930 [Rhynocoris fuscipes]|uniref:ABC transporter domain-containing protein n=1 Tax=Rhynocoris fuscipes TaxID=488301 RepID=A0AAW1DCJ2_9HEMI
MGPSGAGKSTLLNLLTGFHISGMSGEILIDGETREAGKVDSRKNSSYIMQEDHLNPMFTVLEIMTIAANLKLGPPLPKKAKLMVVEDILDSLAMSNTKYTKCGSLSGGQKKRLCIALELIDNPPVMFLDEPTTGLDSSSALHLVKLLKSLAMSGRTIICTIHQPSATVFELFDHIYMLSEGECAYQGSTKNLIPFLHNIGLPCPEYHNPADFLLDVVSGDFGRFNEQLVANARDPVWRNSPSLKRNVESKKNASDNNNGKTCVLISSPSEWTKYSILLKRNVIQLHRDWTITYLKVVLHIMVGIVMGLLFQNAGHDGDKSISNVSFFICALVYQSFTSVMPAVLKFPSEINVLKKEQFNNWYSLRTYYIAFLSANIPVQMFFSFTFISISYYLSSQILELDRYIKFLAVSELAVLISECIGLAIGTVDNPVNGIFWGSVLLAVKVLLAGFLAIFSHMPRPLYYLSYANFMRYTLEAMTISIYGYEREKLPCPHQSLYCHFRYPEKLLNEIAMDKVDYWTDATVLVIFFLAASLNAYFFLHRRVKTR